MIAIGLALLSAFGFAWGAVTARVGMQGIRPLPSVFVSGVASFVPAAILALIFAPSDLFFAPADCPGVLPGPRVADVPGGTGAELPGH